MLPAGLSSSTSAPPTSTAGTALGAAHSRDKLSLCAETIHEHFGPIAGRVAAVLIARGRLSVRDLLYFLSSGPSLGAPAERTKHGPGAITPAQGRVRGISHALHPRAAGLLSRCPTSGSSQSSASSASAPGRRAADEAWPGAGAGAAPATTGRHPLAEPLGPLRRPLEVHHALMVLVQHNVCWHARLDSKGAMLNSLTPALDGSESLLPGTEYFEINPDEVLARLRFGEYIGLALDVFGPDGQAVVQTILQDGKVQVHDLLTRLAGVRPSAPPPPKSTKKSHPLKHDTAARDTAGAQENHDLDGRGPVPPYDPIRYARLEKLLALLLVRGYVRPSVLSAHISAREKAIAYEREYATRPDADGVGGKGMIQTPKLIKEIKIKVRQRILNEERTSYRETAAGQRLGLVPRSAEAVRAMQHSNGHTAGNGSTSRAKPTASSRTSSKGSKGTKRKGFEAPASTEPEGGPNEKEQKVLDENEIDHDIFLRINYERFDVHIRNEVRLSFYCLFFELNFPRLHGPRPIDTGS